MAELSVCQRIKFKVLVIVFKAKCGTGPAYLQELIQSYRQGRELRSVSHHLLYVPFTKSTVISNRAFGVADLRYGMDHQATFEQSPH